MCYRMDSSNKTTSRSTVYRQKKQEVSTKKNTSEPYTLYHKEIVQKCFVDQEVLMAHNTYAIKASFLDEESIERYVMQMAESMHQL